MKLKLTLPVKGTITQGFSLNANPLYHGQGLIGHTGIDVLSFYDDVIHDAVIGFNKKWVYSFINKDNPDVSKYRAVCQIVEADDGVFEVSYGHCNKITCTHGPTTTGQALATEGNTGDVFVNGVAVTKEARDAGSKAGTHVHFQLRRLQKSKEYPSDKLILCETGIYQDEEGYFYSVPNYDNGYNGCIDPMPYIEGKFTFTKDLGLYSINSEVYQLQKRLVDEGFGNFTPTGFFGGKTQAAVVAYQVAKGIKPITGFVGKLTRAKLNS